MRRRTFRRHPTHNRDSPKIRGRGGGAVTLRPHRPDPIAETDPSREVAGYRYTFPRERVPQAEGLADIG
jgi:hypothetical protein